MNYIGKPVNGQATRNNFIRSMDISRNRDPDEALAAYSEAWFSSTRKQYINEAFKLTKPGALFWTKKALTDMLEEILLDTDLGSSSANRELARDIDILKSRLAVWGSKRKNNPISSDQMQDYIRKFEGKYKYRCPDTYRSCWMNTGAYVTLSYGIKYEGLLFPGCTDAEQSLNLLKKCALEVIAAMDHDIDERMFRLCHAIYLQKLENAEKTQ